MKARQFIDHPALWLEPHVATAIVRTIESFQPTLRHLPVPVRFRASGALRAWQAALNELGDAGAARTALADDSVSLLDARRALVAGLVPHVRIGAGAEQVVVPMLQTMLRFSSDMLAFWMRNGALYEPTLPLGALLGSTDIAQDLPLELIEPPAVTLCVVPPWQQRHHCANASAILVFEHGAAAAQAPAQRVLTFLALRPQPDGITTDELVLPVKDEHEALHDVFHRTAAFTRENAAAAGFELDEELDKAAAEWRLILDYVLKVMLYMRLENAAVRSLMPYSSAPKEFPGFGRRKREAKLAEVEQLYDRYIVGPDTHARHGARRARRAPSEGARGAGALAAGPLQVPALWPPVFDAQGDVHRADSGPGGQVVVCMRSLPVRWATVYLDVAQRGATVPAAHDVSCAAGTSAEASDRVPDGASFGRP